LATAPVFQTGEGGFDSPAPLHLVQLSKREESLEPDRLPSSRGCRGGTSQSWRLFGRARAGYAPAPFSSFRFSLRFSFAPSTQGERARLLTGNEAGSIPAGRANAIPARSGNNADSKPAKERSIRLRRCQFARWQSGQCRGLQNRCTAVRFRLARPFTGDHGGMREQANPPRCERGSDRIDTDMSPQFCRHRPVAGQPPCKRPTEVRFPPAGTSSIAASFNGRTTRSERDDRGSIPWAAANRGLLKERASL
jgi:hypothetical protein